MVSLKTESYYLWRDLFFTDFYGNQFKQEDDGILFYGPNRGYLTSDGTVERFLSGPWKDHLASMRAELAELKRALPPPYPFAHTIRDAEKPKVERVRIGGNRDNPGEAVPHHFLSILCDGEPQPFEKGSGRLELADAITDARNPLTTRVMVNRIWQRHFGAGIVRTPSDFGRMGDRPSNPELLDYLASRFVESGWSIKALLYHAAGTGSRAPRGRGSEGGREAAESDALTGSCSAAPPTNDELQLGENFLKRSQNDGWQRYAHALLNSNEFLFVN